MSSHHLLRADGGEPWRDEELMKSLYQNEGLTIGDIADKLGTSNRKISRWMKRHRGDEILEEAGVDIPDDATHRDEDVMRKLYVDAELSSTEIAGVLECSTGTVMKWLQRHEIETRTQSEAMEIASSGGDIPSFYTIESRGYEAINTSDENAYVHRLQAVAYYGFGEVADKQVHHKDGIEWHNTEYNLELLTPRDHISREHGGNIWLDRLRAAEMYRGGASSYDISPTFDVVPGTVLEWVREIDPGLIRTNGGASA